MQVGQEIQCWTHGNVPTLAIVERVYPTAVDARVIGYFQPDGGLYVPPALVNRLIGHDQIFVAYLP